MFEGFELSMIDTGEAVIRVRITTVVVLVTKRIVGFSQFV